MDERGLLDLLIARLPGLSCRERILLCESCARETDLTGRSKGDIERLIGRVLQPPLNMEKIRALAERDAGTARLRGIRWVSWTMVSYPPLLREIYDPPPVLFFRGELPDPEKPLVAVVGTRRPSPQAAVQAYDIAKDLGRRGISVISGLALGIDAMASRGNLEGGVPAFAVLGSGADEVYPAANRHLAKRILESGGALLSEYPPGTGPRKWTFTPRNRIISGMSRSVLIVEAPQRSGALNTARHALEQNRDLWVASTGAAEARTPLCDRRGTLKLAEDGAKIIASAGDILREWNLETQVADTVEAGNGAADGSPAAGGLPAGSSVGMALAASMARSLDIDL
jgi:DNA processing protein